MSWHSSIEWVIWLKDPNKKSKVSIFPNLAFRNRKRYITSVSSRTTWLLLLNSFSTYLTGSGSITLLLVNLRSKYRFHLFCWEVKSTIATMTTIRALSTKPSTYSQCRRGSGLNRPHTEIKYTVLYLWQVMGWWRRLGMGWWRRSWRGKWIWDENMHDLSANASTGWQDMRLICSWLGYECFGNWRKDVFKSGELIVLSGGVRKSTWTRTNSIT